MGEKHSNSVQRWWGKCILIWIKYIFWIYVYFLPLCVPHWSEQLFIACTNVQQHTETNCWKANHTMTQTQIFFFAFYSIFTILKIFSYKPWHIYCSVYRRLCKRWINKGVMQPSSRQRINKHIPVAMNTHTIELLLETAFSAQSVQRGYKEDNWGDLISWELSSAWEAVKTGPEHRKLKNLRCLKPLPGNGWWRYSWVENWLAGAVVICKVWRLVIAL
jgi:hypothetical protein